MDLGTTLQIAQIVVYVLGAAVFVIMLKADIRILRHDMATMKLRQDAINDSFKMLTDVLTKVAVQDTRINAIESSVNELRHNKGFIRD